MTVQARMKMFQDGAYMSSFNFVVRARADADYGAYQIVDGAHRFFAASNIIDRSGLEYFNSLTKSDGLACLVLREDTPDNICIQLRPNKTLRLKKLPK